MVVYVILGYLIGFSIVAFWHLYKIRDYLEDITNELDREHRYNRFVNNSVIFEVVKYLYKDLENKGAVTSDEWTISPEEAEKMYNAALENMRGYKKE